MKEQKFFWGASTASHQVEGNTVNQWTVWELANAARLAKGAKKNYGNLPCWESINEQATKPENYVSGRGVEHYKRYEEDFDILKKLNLNAFRFSIEWSRLQPEEGKWDAAAFQHYREYIKELKKRNIEPFMTLWHWTMPTWFADKGGFAKRSNIKYFEAYVKKVSEELLDDIRYIITINEPNVYMGMSYSESHWPPQEHNQARAIWVHYNLAVAHRRAYQILKSKKKALKIGSAQALANIQAYRPGNYFDEAVVKVMRYFWNWWWLNRVNTYLDFIGLNYYLTDYYRGFKRIPLKTPVNDMGWYMQPEGILPLLQRVAAHFPGKPILVTENGLADAKDENRKWWLRTTMRALDTAISQDIPLFGYLHWSLLDNFEWHQGWWPKFGLVEVDRENGMKRKIRPSAIWWSQELARRRSL